MKIESITGVSGSAYIENTSSAYRNAAENVTADARISTNYSEMQPRMEKQPKTEEERDEKKEGQASEKQIINAVAQTNQKIKGTSLEFSYHEVTKRVSIQVLDKETKEVIREIPPEKSLDMLQKMWELAGILVDEKR